MGREGLKTLAAQNVSLLAYFLDRINEEPGYRVAFSGARFNEVAIACPAPAAAIVEGCLDRHSGGDGS